MSDEDNFDAPPIWHDAEVRAAIDPGRIAAAKAGLSRATLDAIRAEIEGEIAEYRLELAEAEAGRSVAVTPAGVYILAFEHALAIIDRHIKEKGA